MLDWQKHLECQRDPDPSSEREINAFLSLWAAEPAGPPAAAVARFETAVRLQLGLAAAAAVGVAGAEARLGDVQRAVAQQADVVTGHVLQVCLCCVLLCFLVSRRDSVSWNVLSALITLL